MFIQPWTQYFERDVYIWKDTNVGTTAPLPVEDENEENKVEVKTVKKLKMKEVY